jgi:hypothetical protein
MKSVLISCFILFCFTAKAGFIDTTNDSFIDSSTGLEWMDFNKLDETEQYGWRFATFEESLGLALNGMGSIAEYGYYPENIGQISSGSYLALTGDFLDLFKVIGWDWKLANIPHEYTERVHVRNQQGHYHEIDGYRYNDGSPDWRYQYIHMGNVMPNLDGSLPLGNLKLMLVKEVPEPTTFAIFALGLAGVMVGRKRKRHYGN